MEKKKEIVLRTKKINCYFRGYLTKYDEEWQVFCTSYAGGTPDILQIIDWRTRTKSEMQSKIKKFKNKYKLVSRS